MFSIVNWELFRNKSTNAIVCRVQNWNFPNIVQESSFHSFNLDPNFEYRDFRWYHRMLFTKLFSKLYSADFAVGYIPDTNPFTEMGVGEWSLPDQV